MRLRISVLLLAFAAMSEPGFASLPSCEERLSMSFAQLVKKAYEQGVITHEQLAELTHADRPFNPIKLETPGSKNSAFIRAIDAHKEMSEERWRAERAQLQAISGESGASNEVREGASQETAEILSPHLLEEKSTDGVDWIEYQGRVLIATKIDGYPQLRELGKSEPLWTSPEKIGHGEIWFTNLGGDELKLAFSEPHQIRPWERIKYYHHGVIDVHTIDVQSFEEHVDTVADKKPFKGFYYPKDPRKHSNFGKARTFDDVAGWSGNGYNDRAPGGEPVKLNIPGYPPLDFDHKCEGEIEAARVFRGSNNRILLAVDCDYWEVKIFAPYESTEPIFRYEYSRMASDPGWMNIYTLVFFERKGVTYLGVQLTGRRLDIFDIRFEKPVATVDLGFKTGEDFSALKGSDGEMYFLVRRRSMEPKYYRYGVFTKPGR